MQYEGVRYTEGSIQIAMTFMDGGSLGDLVAKTGPLPSDALAAITRQVLGALVDLRERHLVHRDLKPQNILLSLNGDVKVSDFGCVAELQDSFGKCGTFVGTVPYMSPERIQGHEYGYASDVWALGLTLHECAVGHFPYARRNGYWGILQATLKEPSPSLPKSDHPPELVDFVDSCLQKAPDERPSARLLLTDHPFITDAVRSGFSLKDYLHASVGGGGSGSGSAREEQPPSAPSAAEAAEEVEEEVSEDGGGGEEEDEEENQRDEIEAILEPPPHATGSASSRMQTPRGKAAPATPATPMSAPVRGEKGGGSKGSKRGVRNGVGGLWAVAADGGEVKKENIGDGGDGLALEMQRLLEVNTLVSRNASLEERNATLQSETSNLRQELQAIQHERQQLHQQCERSQELIGQLQQRLSAATAAAAAANNVGGTSRGGGSARGGSGPSPLPQLQAAGGGAGGGTPSSAMRGGVGGVRGSGPVGPQHRRTPSEDYTQAEGLLVGGGPVPPFTGPHASAAAAAANDDSVLLMLEPRRLDRMHPADLERLQAVAEGNVREVRNAISRRRSKLQTTRRPSRDTVATTAASAVRTSRDGLLRPGQPNLLTGGKRIGGSRPQSGAPPSLVPPLAERPVTVGAVLMRK